VAIAGEAQQLLDNKVFKATLEAMEREVLMKLERCEDPDMANQQRKLNWLVLEFQKVREFKRKLITTIEATKLRNADG